MKKTFLSIFIGAFLVICLIPLVCMLFAKSEEPVGNETRVELPSWTKEDGSLNTELPGELGNWFEHHFAFRPQLITADAKIQKSVFQVSNTESVVTGTDGWLYYSSTLDDYLGRNTLSQRGMWNLAHNLSLLQQYTESRGAEFLLMVPPNKNTLYGEHMPYYYQRPETARHNRDTLAENLEASGVSYLDLFAFFEAQEEVLYFKEDSHWTTEGARRVYHEALTKLDKAHDDYSSVPVQRAKNHLGDLRAMLYPASDEAEYDDTFQYEQNYQYLPSKNPLSPEVSVEDYRIESTNSKAEGSLLMYRDSFGNSLIPFFANAWGTAVFSKTVPYNLAADLEKCRPDQVVVEKVERNLKDFVKEPAVIPAPQAEKAASDLTQVPEVEVSAEPCLSNMEYVTFRGEMSGNGRRTDSRIYLGIPTLSGTEEIYEAFATCTETSDYGFLVYLPAAQFGGIEAIDLQGIRVYTD